MGRVTIQLSDETHQALKEAAARRGKTLGEVVEESLELFGIKTQESAADLVARSRQVSRLREERALDIAVSETRAARR